MLCSINLFSVFIPLTHTSDNCYCKFSSFLFFLQYCFHYTKSFLLLYKFCNDIEFSDSSIWHIFPFFKSLMFKACLHFNNSFYNFGCYCNLCLNFFYDPITSQGPHLQISSYYGVVFNLSVLGRCK